MVVQLHYCSDIDNKMSTENPALFPRVQTGVAFASLPSRDTNYTHCVHLKYFHWEVPNIILCMYLKSFVRNLGCLLLNFVIC